ncbi:hypothetical protein TWF788_003192 [Orbilia oligospora]|uniref:Uncharacterized protein n=1 Tax=Orbilia oligospora TaxID=2813651 RepID=A0A6G1MDL0_ORBOL|nr:hypothetical protein TWF788_003192 [Orbilia oligospora]KAF3204548.1 hypothetical protein TWF191_002242 [Orbilia oligospora]KAF3222336.1 hypothetical protein TWF679_005817 [Orbilia oligospora]KAF3253454.1 hypothetical protein TWF192_003708 [Orbilia oligospora]
MPKQTFTASQLYGAVKQIFDAPNFEITNPHLTEEEVANLRLNINWPNKPVYSPYATTKAKGYSQIRSVHLGSSKYYTHRITYRQFQGEDPDEKDVSHTLYIGSNTCRNINPVFLVAETNNYNQSRKACFLYFEELLQERYENMGSHFAASGSLESWGIKVRSTNGLCQRLHKNRMCCFAWVDWVMDYKARKISNNQL